ncbi:hypothetical protein D9757_006762 [Collybiopsis confluens]|uniref:RlpA-like protein double-psi beta-barrel domain-containing protein n=1 Tax=Collybiopsis confluens TaxID=2823264 RepID=A0A8H5HL81_9AGAR|nr:hypothetical protein D9757_006762 [Collybiopsis confluens]
MFSSATKFSAVVAVVVSSVALLAVPATAIPINTTVSARATFAGDGTFYEAGIGACGIVNTDADLIAAVGHGTFDTFPGATANPNLNPICGKKIIANFGGKSVTVAITDRCAGCAGAADLDFTPTAFGLLADLSVGRIHGVTWDFA